jgi:hypothetical protein
MTLLLGVLCFPAAAPVFGNSSAAMSAPVDPIPSEARCLAMESAEEVVARDGFRIRDAEWPFSLSQGIPQFLQVTLFSGEHYWFVAASPTSGAKLKVSLYDSEGLPVTSQQWDDGGAHQGARAGVGMTPRKSGLYYVGVEILSNPSNLPLDCSLVTAYK